MKINKPIDHCWEDFVQTNSKDSFYALYRHYHSYLCFISLKRGFNAEVVKDTIHDVFLYLWEKRKTLQHIQNSHNYILTFFHRAIAKKTQHETSHFNPADEIEFNRYAAFTEPSFEQALLNRENEKRLAVLIHKHLDQLPPRQREILYQKFFLGCSYAEIAKANRLSVNTVYNTVYSAMQKLRSSLPAASAVSFISGCIGLFLFFF
ncbi:MAG: sigma-70 family RNA polymerase sigma factor [Chitinophagaceae bacterium]|nr:sigma-70 family RNA polymerase sigma factor [Chitinophagaceae bacterium]